MARPQRNNVDYFPFYCKEGKAMHYIEQKYGNDGYATWIKILRQLAVTNDHYLNLSDNVEFMYLCSKCRLPEESLRNIISDLCKLGEFNRELWEESQVVFSEKFMESIKDAYAKRNSKCMNLPGLLLLLSSLGIRKPPQPVVSGDINPQSKVKKIKVNKTKEKETKKTEVILEEKIIDPFPFQIEFLNLWEKWKKYRKEEFKKKWASLDTEQIAFNHLVDISGKDEEVAKKIINESISQHWQGLFPLKNNLQNGAKNIIRHDRPTAERKSDFGGKF